MKRRGDIVQYFTLTGGTHSLEAQTLLGCVTQAGPKRFTVLWESGLQNRVQQGNREVKIVTDPELILEANPFILNESIRIKESK